MNIEDIEIYLQKSIDKLDKVMSSIEDARGISNHSYISSHGAKWAYEHILKFISENKEDRNTINITDDARINIQYKILQFLLNNYYYDDEEYAHENARKDSYKIITIIVGALNENQQTD